MFGPISRLAAKYGLVDFVRHLIENNHCYNVSECLAATTDRDCIEYLQTISL